jgi:hypothetical protein
MYPADARPTVASWQVDVLVRLKSRYAGLVGGGRSFSSGITIL